MINRIRDNVMKQEVATQETTETAQEQILEQPKSSTPDTVHSDTIQSSKYASSLMAERRLSSFAQEFTIRNMLDAQLITAPNIPQSPPAGIGSIITKSSRGTVKRNYSPKTWCESPEKGHRSE